jgi:Zn-dependent protease with chaperone function
VNFFQAQDDARKKTWQLALLFGGAVVSLIVLTNLLVAAVYVWTGNYAQAQPMNVGQMLMSLPVETWVFISLGVVGMVGVASLYKYLVVRGGGRTIAESLGGRLLSHDTATGNQKRLLNVVEEMAIASGVPVPPVYLIPEPSINAFAAGFGPDDAIIGINQGTVDHLSRDELQGVVAHEFSHILNGDVGINLRLIAILHGILFLGMIGYGILRGFGYSRSRKGDNAAPVLALGVGLLVIGYAGTFFGNLIKAAVSRQREYLADAAAVQFTRNPPGIAGALKKIGGLSEGSRIEKPAASEASHMFFGQVKPIFMAGLLSTHPPLDKRIRAIEPGWDGEYPRLASAVGPGAVPETAAGFASGAAALAGAAALPESGDRDSLRVEAAPRLSNVRVDADPDAIVERIGTLDSRGLEAAQVLIASTDEALREAAHDPWGSRGLIYAILLDTNATMRDRQFAHLQQEAERGVPEHTARLAGLVDRLDPPRRLALVEMAMPALKALSKPQYERFTANVVELIKMDRVISLPEWVLHRLLVKELKPHFEGPVRLKPKHDEVKDLPQQGGTLLYTIARFGHDSEAARVKAFTAGTAALDLDGTVNFESADDLNFARLNEALKDLRLLKPLAKPKLIKACAATALSDGHVSGLEGALLQGFAAALDCPLPPSIYSADVIEAGPEEAIG